MKSPHDTGHTDISREGLTFAKVRYFLRVLFAYPVERIFARVTRFSDIDGGYLMDRGIRGMILDFDDCLAPHHGNILPEYLAHVRTLCVLGLALVVFSNRKKDGRYASLESLGVRVITPSFAKPDIRGFEACLRALDLPPHSVVMVGDNYITDGGCVEAGISFIHVQLLPSRMMGVSRGVQRLARYIARAMVERRIRRYRARR